MELGALGSLMIVWTARLAVGCYLGRIAIDVALKADDVWQRRGRWLWTIGLAIFLLHVVAAMHFQHHWSLAAAWEHVRQQTRTLAGWDSGFGLVVNFAFAGLWLADCGLWWRSLAWPRRRLPYGIVQAAFAFLVFNATIVFGPRAWIGVGVVVATALSAIAVSARMKMAHVP
jgi:hypothetical protein